MKNLIMLKKVKADVFNLSGLGFSENLNKHLNISGLKWEKQKQLTAALD